VAHWEQQARAESLDLAVHLGHLVQVVLLERVFRFQYLLRMVEQEELAVTMRQITLGSLLKFAQWFQT
jgi:hypothetical protein